MKLRKPDNPPAACECTAMGYAGDSDAMCGECFFAAFEEAFERGELPDYQRRPGEPDVIELKPEALAQLRKQICSA